MFRLHPPTSCLAALSPPLKLQLLLHQDSRISTGASKTLRFQLLPLRLRLQMLLLLQDSKIPTIASKTPTRNVASSPRLQDSNCCFQDSDFKCCFFSKTLIIALYHKYVNIVLNDQSSSLIVFVEALSYEMTVHECTSISIR